MAGQLSTIPFNSVVFLKIAAPYQQHETYVVTELCINLCNLKCIEINLIISKNLHGEVFILATNLLHVLVCPSLTHNRRFCPFFIELTLLNKECLYTKFFML